MIVLSCWLTKANGIQSCEMDINDSTVFNLVCFWWIFPFWINVCLLLINLEWLYFESVNCIFFLKSNIIHCDEGSHFNYSEKIVPKCLKCRSHKVIGKVLHLGRLHYSQRSLVINLIWNFVETHQAELFEVRMVVSQTKTFCSLGIKYF